MFTFPDFKRTKILVLGDVMLDRYWSGSTTRISPEAPVPIVRIEQPQIRVGGAANVALNLHSLGITVQLVGVIGLDEDGRCLERELRDLGLNHDLISLPSIATTTKLRVMSRHQQLIRLDFETTQTDLPLENIIEHYRQHLADVDMVILSDYGKGLLSDPQPFIKLAREMSKPVLVDPKGSDFVHRYHGATLVTPNRQEFEAEVGVCLSEEALLERARSLIEAAELNAILITRGEQGMTLIQRNGETKHLPTQAKEVFDVTGAGDTAIAVLAASIAGGSELEQAMQLANLAAGIVVGRLGAVSVTLAELETAFYHQCTDQLTIVTEEQLLTLCRAARLRGERLVMTNGCFDLLHAGHVKYLHQAKMLGDRLIVAVNVDETVSVLKGNGRPINSLNHRMQVLAGLKSVDWVVAFKEMTPERLIRAVMPDVLVKGGDYHPQQIAGAEVVLANGGEVKVIDFELGCSTTNIVNKILQPVLE